MKAEKTSTHALAALAAQVEERYRLVFRWPEKTSSLLLPLLFIISVAIHGAAFYIFQVQYPPSVVSAPPPAHITLLTDDTPGGAALLRWVAARDPATAAAPLATTPPQLGQIRYVPSYAEVQTPPLEPQPAATPVPTPAARNLLDWTIQHPTQPVKETPRRVVSSLHFSSKIRQRDAAPGAPLPLTARSSANLHRTVFLTAVSGEGKVRYCFLQEQSGDPVMDAQAETILRAHPFRPSATPLEWGYSILNWGAEAYAPPTPSPTPLGATGT